MAPLSGSPYGRPEAIMKPPGSSLYYKGSASRFMAGAGRIRTHLRRGGVIAYATESCFGLGCDPRNYRATRRILRLKGRPQRKGLILVGASFAQLAPYVLPLGATEREIVSRYWPGPYTMLMPTPPQTPRWLTGRHATLAVRVTAHRDTARLCAITGSALVSTSANRSGLRALKTAAACRRAFGSRALVVPGRIGRRKRPSTIMDLRSGAVFRP